MTKRTVVLMAALLGVSLHASAARGDTASAVDELKAGYALKAAGNCKEAVGHFARSVQLAEAPKSLLNLADCEQRLGDLVAAHQHAARGQALAVERHDAELVPVAATLVATIDTKLPRVTITLKAGVPQDCAVTLDGASVPLSVAEPVNPGEHTIVVTAAGHADRTLPVTVAEATQQTVAVEAGSPTAAATSPENTGDLSRADRRPTGTRSLIALGVGGAGVVGVVIGSGLGLSAISKNNASNANGHCDSSGCDATGKQLRNEALSQATASTISFTLGLAAVAGSVVLYVTAPSEDSKSVARVELRPAVGRNVAGLLLGATW